MNAVAPDFVDGGFRLAEHLFRLDCRTVIAVTNEVTRETIATLNGVHTAAARFGGQVVESPMRMDDAGRSVITVGRDDMDRTTGIILIGSAAIAAFLDDARLVAEWNGGRWAVCALPDIGDPRAAQAGLTTYESDPGTVCRWAARLMNDARLRSAQVVDEAGRPIGSLELSAVISAMVTPPQHKEKVAAE